MSRHLVPEDPDAERSLLATLCAPGAEHAASLCLPSLCPEDFLTPAHRAIFEAMQMALAAHQELGLLAIRDVMDARGTLARAGGLAGLSEVLDGQEVGKPQVLIEILTGHRRRRELLRLGNSLQVLGQDTAEDPENLIHTAQAELARIMRDGRSDPGEGWMEILHSMAAMEPFCRPGQTRGGWWGLPTLDQVAPIPAGEFVTVGARPGVGKTALMTQIAVETAKKGMKTLVVSLELTKESMRARLASYLSKVPMSTLKRGEYTVENVNRVGTKTQILQAGRLQCPTAGTPWPKLEAMIRHEVDRHQIQTVLLDQFDKIGRGQVGRGSSEAYAFGAVSTGIMGLAQELGIGFVLLCQLKGDAEGREPTLADHADSDRPGKDGAVVLHLWRDKENQIKAKLQKNRDGSHVGRRWKLDFRGNEQHFYEIEQETDPNPIPLPQQDLYS